VINMGIWLYNSVPDIQQPNKHKPFKRTSKSSLMNHAFYSIEDLSYCLDNMQDKDAIISHITILHYPLVFYIFYYSSVFWLFYLCWCKTTEIINRIMLNAELSYAWCVQSNMYDWMDWIKNWIKKGIDPGLLLEANRYVWHQNLFLKLFFYNYIQYMEKWWKKINNWITKNWSQNSRSLGSMQKPESPAQE
jgi:hypothetical protein